MKQIDAYSEAFQARIEAFTIGCDSLEEIDCWDKNTFGELDVYYINELVSVILLLISADGVINDNETEYLNQNFGFFYTTEELREVYENCKDEIGGTLEERLREDVAVLDKINTELTEEFKGMLGLICDIIACSDRTISLEEEELIEKIHLIIK